MYAICDKDCKVIRTSNNEVSNLTKFEMVNPISNVMVGTFSSDDVLNKFINLFKQFEFISTLGAGANNFFKTMSFEDRHSIEAGVYDIKCITRDNVTVNFIKANELLDKKLEKFLVVYSQNIQSNSIITIYSNNGEVIAGVENN